MGDIDKMWKKIDILREHQITDEENADLIRPYFGNPFKAPGTIGSKAKIEEGQQGKRLYEKDESIFEMTDEEFLEDGIKKVKKKTPSVKPH